jgi:hypothetical protein
MLKFLLPLVLSCATAIAADEYELRMERLGKVGDRASVSGSRQLRHLLEVKVDAQVVKNERIDVDIEYEVEREILAVNEQGKTMRDRLTIRKITGIYNGDPVTQFKAGDLVETSTEGAGIVTLINGEKATTEQIYIGRALPKRSNRGSVTDDEAFGPGRKIKVGDEWPIKCPN